VTSPSLPVVLDVPVFAQSPSSCGPTSLKSVLWFHGQRVPIKRLAHVCGLTDDGTDHGALVGGALRAGARVFERSNGTLAELEWFVKAGLPPIVGWWSRDRSASHFDGRWSLEQRKERDCGHYSACRGVSRERIWLMDPQWRRHRSRWQLVGNRTMSVRDFRTIWYDTDTGDYRRVDRWYMVVHFGKDRFAPRFRGGVDHG